MKKLKIIEIIPSLFPVGGAETLFTNLCINLKEAHDDNVDLFVVVLYKQSNTFLENKLLNHGIKCYWLDKKKGIDFKCSRKLKKIIKEVKPDIVHTHGETTTTMLISYPFKKPFCHVHTIHNMIGKDFKSERLNMFLIKRKWFIPVAICKQSAISIRNKTKLECRYINNGIDLNEFDYSKPIKNRKIDFLCVASFTPVKNQKYILDRFSAIQKKYPKLNLVFLGDGPLKKDCEEYSRLLNLKNVSFEGSVSNVSQYMSNSKILLMSSKSEGNPMSVNEAIASGMYIVASNVGGLPDLISDQKTGLLINLVETNRYEQSIIKLIDNEYFLESNRLNNQNKYEQISITKTATEYIDFFYKLLEH